MGIGFWIGLFVLFLFGFEFINVNAGPVRTPLIHYILSLFFMALTFMLIFSNAVIALQNLFREHETAFLFSLPLRHDTIYLYKFVESLLFSSWAVFAAGLPLMPFQRHANRQVDWYFSPLVLVFMIPFVVLPAAIGTTLGLLLTAIVPRQGKKLLIFMAGMVLARFRHLPVLQHFPRARRLNGLVRTVGDPGQRAARAGTLVVHPERADAQLLDHRRAAARQRRQGRRRPRRRHLPGSAVQQRGYFLPGARLVHVRLDLRVDVLLRQRRRHSPGAPSAVRLVDALSSAPLLARSPQLVILVVKDVKTFMRDPTQWSQALIFFGILVLYIGNLRNFSYPLEQPFYQNLISFLNLGATCMTLATVTSRFVFPLISLEGRRFWVLALQPLERHPDVIMLSEILDSLSGGSLLLVISLVMLSNYILRTSTALLALQLSTGVLLALGLSGLSVGMGAIFPSFNERNPSKIVSGFGGTLTLILAIGLVMVCVIGEGIVCNKHLSTALSEDPSPERTHAWLLVGGALRAAAPSTHPLAAAVPMRAGIRALQRVEF